MRLCEWRGLNCYDVTAIHLYKAAYILRISGNTLKKQKEGVFMARKKEKPIDLNSLEPEEKLKYEIAEELGLLDRVLDQGWKSLTSKETGRIGGMVTKKKRQRK